MHEKPKLHCTRDYGIFETHKFQRPQHEDAVLLASMRKHGFLPSKPISVTRNGKGGLTIGDGHHRFEFAKRLKLPVWYVVEDNYPGIFDVNGSSKIRWSAPDFLFSHAQAGNADCATALAFMQKHQLTIGAAVSLVGGESAGSSNKLKAVKDGTFKAAPDQSHARAVTGITDRCRDHGVSFATSSAFVAAVSKVVHVPEFDGAVFLHRVALNGSQMKKRTAANDYLDEIEALYNYAAKGKRIPLAFRARELSKARQVACLGSKNVTKKHKA